MFQKLKDKLAEEVKQSSLKLPVSVQQLTQAVTSVSPNKLLNSEPSKEKESEDVLNESSSDFNSEFDSSFTTIDLRSPTPNRNRRSSSSSDLFPIYEFLPTRHNLQSDLESNSEFDDGSSIHQFTNVSKEILYEKYRNMLQKYHKYRGRFVDMRKYCLEMEREHEKIKNVLTETQDKAIRRTKELKEQCALEQTAKAHLEGVLRNELEERDLIISTLNTKIKLLKSGKDTSVDESSKLVDFSKNQAGCDQVHFTNSFQEVELLKDKIKNFELLLSKAKEAITTKNNQLKILEGRIETGKNELKASNEHIARLQNEIDLMKRKEEEALLSLAENKMVVHRELEAKEKHIKILEDKINRYESETQKLKTREPDAFSNLEKSSTEELRAKEEEIQSLKNELHQLRSTKSAGSEETLIELDQLSKADDNQNATKIEYLRQIEFQTSLILEKEKELTAKDQELDQLKQIRTRQENDISNLRNEVSRMKDDLSDQSEIRDEISSLNKSLCQMRDALSEKDQQLKLHLETINKLRSELSAVNTKLTDASKYQKMYEDAVTNSKADKIVAEEMMKNAKNELNASQAELKNAKATIEKYESELKAKEQMVEENQKLEKQLLEYKNNLTEMSKSLEQAQKVELEIHVQTASFLEEINKLKSKEDEYLTDIRKLKENISSYQNLDEEVNRVRAALEETQQRCEKLSAENEKINKLKSKEDDYLTDICKLKEDLSIYKNLDEVVNRLRAALEETQQQCEKLSAENEEINKLKSKEDEYLADIRKLKEDLSNYQNLNKEINGLKAALEDSQQRSEKLAAEREAVQLENSSCKKTIKELEGHVAELEQSFAAKIQTLEAEQKILEADRQKYTSESAEENADLKLENARIIENNEEMSERIGKLFVENKKLQDELEVLKEHKVSWNSQIEKLRQHCQINDFSDEQTLAALPEKFIEHTKKIEELQSENDALKSEVAKTKALVEELENWQQKFETIVSEKGKLEEKLSEERGQLEELQLQCTQIQNELEANKKYKEKYEKLISDLEEKLALSAQTSEPLNEEVQNVNKLPETCSKLVVGELETTAEKSLVDAILLIRSQLLDVKAKNAEVKQNLLDFCKFSTNSADDLSLAHLMNVVQKCQTENRSICEEVLLLRKEKLELLRKLENLEKEIEDFKVEATENLHNRESFYKEKYAQEMMEIITGYEKRLAEKDNEYELLQNKMNLRNDRENTAMYQETKEVIRNLQEELTTRQDSYSELLVKHRDEVEELNQKLSELKEQYARDLRDNDKRWRSCLDKKMDEVEEKYKEEINELTKEWTIDRKPSSASSEVNSKDSEEFLEDSAERSEDSEALKKQVQVLSNELNSCKRSHWREIDLNLMNASYENTHHSNLTLEDCTEMEYLRNILFKYMMGHQPMVLAKVLAAVVKFDNQQTEQILQREEQKQTLIGHLGFT